MSISSIFPENKRVFNAVALAPSLRGWLDLLHAGRLGVFCLGLGELGDTVEVLHRKLPLCFVLVDSLPMGVYMRRVPSIQGLSVHR